MRRNSLAVVAVAACLTLMIRPAAAQEPVAGGGAAPASGPGWTFTPALGFATTYDDNITLSGRGTVEEQNDDAISTYAPSADLSYRGRRTSIIGGYSGSFLSYRTYSLFNRWNQRVRVDARQQVTQRLQVTGSASGQTSPSTETVDLDGIPFSQTGTRVFNTMAASSYRLSARDSMSGSVSYQDVEFDRPAELREYLRGGHAFSTSAGYRRKATARMSFGADYGFRRASVADDVDAVVLHSVQTAVEYQLSPEWMVEGGAGIVMVEGGAARAQLGGTETPQSQRAPAYRGAARWDGTRSTLHVGYSRSLMASFGIGGTVRTQELGASFRTALSRRFYTNQSAMFRDSTPVLERLDGTLRLRSFRTNSVVGWAPQPWVRVEMFYARTFQTTLLPGGRIDRNRVGLQIVTSRPMRMQ